MFRGTTIDELMETVERAEQHARESDHGRTMSAAGAPPAYATDWQPTNWQSIDWQTRDWRELVEVA